MAAIKQNRAVVISKSRSKKKPFKLAWIAKNGEPIDSAQLLTSRANVIKNILSVVDICRGTKVEVLDISGKVQRYNLFPSGKKEQLNVI